MFGWPMRKGETLPSIESQNRAQYATSRCALCACDVLVDRSSGQPNEAQDRRIGSSGLPDLRPAGLFQKQHDPGGSAAERQTDD